MNSELALIRPAVPINNTDHVIDSQHVVTALVEYGDFDCPTCERMNTCVRAPLTLSPATAVRVPALLRRRSPPPGVDGGAGP
jgi:hypothetical protein